MTVLYHTNYMLEPRSRFVFIVLAIGIVVSIGATYWSFVVKKDFLIINDVDTEMGDTSANEG